MKNITLPKKGLEFKLALGDEVVGLARVLKKVLIDELGQPYWVLRIWYVDKTMNMPEVIIQSDKELIKLLNTPAATDE